MGQQISKEYHQVMCESSAQMPASIHKTAGRGVGGALWALSPSLTLLLENTFFLCNDKIKNLPDKLSGWNEVDQMRALRLNNVC